MKDAAGDVTMIYCDYLTHVFPPYLSSLQMNVRRVGRQAGILNGIANRKVVQALIEVIA